MKRSLLILSILLFYGLAAAQPQSVVWEMSSPNYDTTIVRHWQGDEYIVYTSTGVGPGMVSYHNNASGTTVSAKIPANVIINDFRIANDSVFAGGSFVNYSTKQGLLACFSISELLSGNVQYRSVLLPPASLLNSICGTTGLEIRITGVTRLALYKYGGGTRIAYIAENHIADLSGNVAYYRVGFGDAAFLSGSNLWDLCSYHYNKDGIESYTDICTTDHKIVVTAKSDDYGYHNLRFQVFDKTRDYAIAPPGPYSTRYGYTDHRALAKVMVTHLKNDDVAVAYHYSDGAKGGLAVKTIDVGGSSPVLINNREIPEDTTFNIYWHMNDIRYDYGQDELLILNKIDDPLMGLESYIFKIHAPYASGASCIVESCPFMKITHSLDNFGSNRFIASGRNAVSANPNIFNEFLGATSSCGSVGKAKCDYNLPITSDDRPRHHCTVWLYSIPSPIPTSSNSEPTSHENINPICRKP